MNDNEIIVNNETVLKYPKKYYETMNKVIDYAKEIFKDNLCNITLGGSGGKGKIIEDWSDLDFYIILQRYNHKEIATFMKATSNLEIHIGTTFYTLYEIENDLIDSKTKIMCYEKQNYPVNPTLYGEEVFKQIDYETIVENDINNLPNILHDFRRRYIDLISNEDKKVDKTYVKKMLVLIKCLLNYHRIFSYGYDNCLTYLRDFIDKEGYDLTPILQFDIMNSIKNIDTSKEEIVNFSTQLLNFIEFIYIKKGENKKWKKELVLEQ